MNVQKRFFLIFIAIVMFLLFIPCFVNADTVDTDTVQRYVDYKGQDSSGNHIFDFCIYLSDGKQEGSLTMPNYIYENTHWFLAIPKNNSKNLYFVYVPTYDNLYLEGSSYNFRKNPTDTKSLEVAYFGFDFSGNPMYDGTLPYLGGSSFKFEPNSVIYSKGLELYRFSSTDTSKIYSLDLLKEIDSFKCPRFTYLVNKGFRVYLNDFVGNTTTDYLWEVTRSLTKVTIKVKNVNNSSVLFSDDNVLSYTDVQIDNSNRYYIDLLFSDYLSCVTSSSGDYFIELTLNLQSQRKFLATRPYIYADSTTLYPFTSFAKFSYKKDTNSGVLIDVDKDGNEIVTPGSGGEDNLPEEVDKTEEAIKEQTNAIKEQTEVSKNIFQQIIELPRQDNRFIA